MVERRRTSHRSSLPARKGQRVRPRLHRRSVREPCSRSPDGVTDRSYRCHRAIPRYRSPPGVMCPTRRTARCAAAAELLGRVRAELPAVGELGERDQVLVSAWLTRLRSARTRRAYAGDVAAWLGWLTDRETGALAAGRVHVDLWAATSWMTGRRPPACAAACRRCRRSTGTARPMTWSAGCPPRAWRGRRWIRTTPPRWAGPGPRLGPGRRGRRRQRSRGAAHRGGGAAAAAQRPARRRGLRRRHRRPGRGLQPPGAARGSY